jgi:hypothetical protein
MDEISVSNKETKSFCILYENKKGNPQAALFIMNITNLFSAGMQVTN